MKYIDIEDASEVWVGQATRRRRNRRHCRHKRVLGLVLTAAVVLGAWYAVSSVTGWAGNLKDNFWNVSDSNAAGGGNNAAVESDTLRQLKALARKNSGIGGIVRNADAYPEGLLKLLVSNQETLSFVQDYPKRNGAANSSGLRKDDLSGKIPLLLQWDERWGYNKYGSDMLAITGCGPTALSMVVVGLTGDLSADPGAVAAFSQTHGYCVDGNGTAWELMTSGAKHYGLTAAELPLWENSIIQQIQAGHPVICIMGPGAFTTTGHFIVIYGYENSKFLINDPNSKARSSQQWTYSSLKSQIRNLWAYST